jgi:hypothetical protein
MAIGPGTACILKVGPTLGGGITLQVIGPALVAKFAFHVVSNGNLIKVDCLVATLLWQDDRRALV